MQNLFENEIKIECKPIILIFNSNKSTLRLELVNDKVCFRDFVISVMHLQLHKDVKCLYQMSTCQLMKEDLTRGRNIE